MKESDLEVSLLPKPGVQSRPPTVKRHLLALPRYILARKRRTRFFLGVIFLCVLLSFPLLYSATIQRYWDSSKTISVESGIGTTTVGNATTALATSALSSLTLTTPIPGPTTTGSGTTTEEGGNGGEHESGVEGEGEGQAEVEAESEAEGEGKGQLETEGGEGMITESPPNSSEPELKVEPELEEVDPNDTNYPPRYDYLREWERNLPQHNLSLPYPEGNTGRYIKFSCQIRQLGWNNVMNELLMNSYLAYKSHRAYVFMDYAWKIEYYPWPASKAHHMPPLTPLPALLSGPTAGGPWEANDTAPRSVSSAYFDLVCPPSERLIINTRDVKPWDKYNLVEADGKVVFDTWLRIIEKSEERCIEIVPADTEEDNFPQVFDLWLWGTSRILSLWEEFRDSPVSRLLATSPVVERAVNRNEPLFYGPTRTTETMADDLPTTTTPNSVSDANITNPYDRMLAIHLRRGDYQSACKRLSDYNSTFYSWNLLPFLPDAFTPPPGGEMGNNTEENEAIYMKRCLPTDEAILKKIEDSRQDYVREIREKSKDIAEKGEERVLDVLYMLTNDETGWVEEVKQMLMNKDGWRVVVTSKEIVLADPEEKDVGMTVDMEIARKAAVFIGNGWSSFTSNILHRRLVDGKLPISNRFY